METDAPEIELDVNSESDKHWTSILECHITWKPCEANKDTIDRLKRSLMFRRDTEPALGALHCVSLAYLCFLEEKEAECEQWLNASDTEARKVPSKKRKVIPVPPVDASFLAAALRLHLLHRFHPDEEAERQKLQELQDQWKRPDVRASFRCAKGWALQSFGHHNTDNAIAAFHQSLKGAKAALRFHSLYGLAAAMERGGRKGDLSAEIGDERLELWREAKMMLKEQWTHPVFLAEFARAICNTKVHANICRQLANQALEEADGLVRHFKVYVIIPKVYRALTKLLSKGPTHRDEKNVLNNLELAALNKGKAVYDDPGNQNESLKSEFALQFAMYHIKVQSSAERDAGKKVINATTEYEKNGTDKEKVEKARKMQEQVILARYKEAEQWLDKVDNNNIWARLRMLSVRESKLELLSAELSKIKVKEYTEIKAEYDDLLSSNSTADGNVKKLLDFECGRFLLVRWAADHCLVPGVGELIQQVVKVKQALEELPSIRFMSPFKRGQLLDSLEKIKRLPFEGRQEEMSKLITDITLELRLVRNSRFPYQMYKDHYRWRLACDDCVKPLDDSWLDQESGVFKVTKLAHEHACKEDLLLVCRPKTEQWSLVRPHEPGNSGAKNDEEKKLWKLMVDGKFNMEKFLEQVRQRRQ